MKTMAVFFKRIVVKSGRVIQGVNSMTDDD